MSISKSVPTNAYVRLRHWYKRSTGSSSDVLDLMLYCCCCVCVWLHYVRADVMLSPQRCLSKGGVLQTDKSMSLLNLYTSPSLPNLTLALHPAHAHICVSSCPSQTHQTLHRHKNKDLEMLILYNVVLNYIKAGTHQGRIKQLGATRADCFVT